MHHLLLFFGWLFSLLFLVPALLGMEFILTDNPLPKLWYEYIPHAVIFFLFLNLLKPLKSQFFKTAFFALLFVGTFHVVFAFIPFGYPPIDRLESFFREKEPCRYRPVFQLAANQLKKNLGEKVKPYLVNHAQQCLERNLRKVTSQDDSFLCRQVEEPKKPKECFEKAKEILRFKVRASTKDTSDQVLVIKEIQSALKKIDLTQFNTKDFNLIERHRDANKLRQDEIKKALEEVDLE